MSDSVIDYHQLAKAIKAELTADRPALLRLVSPWIRGYKELSAYTGMEVRSLYSMVARAEFLTPDRRGWWHIDDVDRFLSRGRRGNTWGKK